MDSTTVNTMIDSVESSVIGAEFALKLNSSEKELERNKVRLENSLDKLSLLTRFDNVKTTWLETYKSRVWNKLFKIDKVLGVA